MVLLQSRRTKTFQIHPCLVRLIFVLLNPGRASSITGRAGCAPRGSSEVQRCSQSFSNVAGYASRGQTDIGTAREAMGSGACPASAVGAARSAPLNMHLGHEQLIGPACAIQCVAENTPEVVVLLLYFEK